MQALNKLSKSNAIDETYCICVKQPPLVIYGDFDRSNETFRVLVKP